MLVHFPLLLLAAMTSVFDINPPDATHAVHSEAVAAQEHRSLGLPRRAIAAPAAQRATENAHDDAQSMPADGSVSTIRGELWQVLGALGSVLALIFLMRAVLLRSARHLSIRSTGTQAGSVLNILARYPIARGQHLVLLKLDKRILLLHENTAGKSMTALSEITDPAESAALLKTLTGHDLHADARGDHAQIADTWHDGEVVDLTRKPAGGLARLFTRSTSL